MDDDSQARLGNEAKAFLANPAWVKAWEAYRAHLLQIIEDADCTNTTLIDSAKRHLVAAKAAKSHLEALVSNGKVALATIALEERRKKRLFGLVA